MTEPCSGGNQTDYNLEGRTKGYKPSSGELPPETQVWKEGEGVDGDDSELESLAGLEEDSSPNPLIPTVAHKEPISFFYYKTFTTNHLIRMISQG